MKTVRLMTCENVPEAAIIKGRLENEGISCFITNENFTTMMPHFNGILGAGVQIIINESNFEEATKILKLNEPVKNQIICPYCHASNIRFGLGKKRIGKIILILLSILIVIPFKNLNNNYYCLDCKSDFKV